MQAGVARGQRAAPCVPKLGKAPWSRWHLAQAAAGSRSGYRQGCLASSQGAGHRSPGSPLGHGLDPPPPGTWCRADHTKLPPHQVLAGMGRRAGTRSCWSRSCPPSAGPEPEPRHSPRTPIPVLGLPRGCSPALPGRLCSHGSSCVSRGAAERSRAWRLAPGAGSRSTVQRARACRCSYPDSLRSPPPCRSQQPAPSLAHWALRARIGAEPGPACSGLDKQGPRAHPPLPHPQHCRGAGAAGGLDPRTGGAQACVSLSQALPMCLGQGSGTRPRCPPCTGPQGDRGHRLHPHQAPWGRAGCRCSCKGRDPGC